MAKDSPGNGGRGAAQNARDVIREDAIEAKEVIRVALINAKAVRVWDWIIKASIPVVVALCGLLIQHEIRLTRIESTFFSDQDGRALERRLMEAMPPKWVSTVIDELKVGQKDMADRQFAILDRISRIEEKLIKDRK